MGDDKDAKPYADRSAMKVVRELHQLTGVIMAPEDKKEYMENYAEKPKEEIFLELKKATGKIGEQAMDLEHLKDVNTAQAEKIIKLELALKIQQGLDAPRHPHDVSRVKREVESTEPTAIVKK